MAFQKGDRVVVTVAATATQSSGYGTREITPGSQGTVTSVRSDNVVNVRFKGGDYPYVMTVNARNAGLVDASDTAAVAAIEAEAARIKALTEPGPNDIMPDDPRIAWLWRKIEQDPEVKRYCSIYDGLTDKFGIPGREREWDMEFSLNGMSVSVENVKGHNLDEAKAVILAAFPGATDIEEQ